MTFPKMKIEVDGCGRGQLWIDDKEVGHMVSGINVKIRSGKLTKVYLEMTADTAVEVNGLIETAGIDGLIRHAKKPI